MGDEVEYSIECRCTICRKKFHDSGKMSRPPIVKVYRQKLPEPILSGEFLDEKGNSYPAIKGEISKLNNYLEYHRSLKGKICELAGHTMEIDGNCCRCICCGNTMSVAEYKDYLEDNPITYTREDLLSLPTFEEYQHQQEGEKKDHPKEKIKNNETK